MLRIMTTSKVDMIQTSVGIAKDPLALAASA